jgi:hypothetical protein
VSLLTFLEAIDERVLVCDRAMVIARELVGAARPLVTGMQVGTAGRDFSSILGVLEAIA